MLPTLGSILSVLLEPTADILGSGSLLENARVSLVRVSLGFLLAAFLAVPLGVAMGRWEVFKDTTESL
ncbi:MAG: sulfonate transport system permease protein, partial [Euryarchaeota archaeon]|nr:sulfonate transport system permease protein [Euryarchaeota archaeon]